MGDFTAFYAAIAGASGALVGLLFVAASVSREDMFGENASVRNRARSSLALTALVTPLIVALFALIPGIGLRVPLLVAGIGGILFTAAAIRRVVSSRDSRHGWRQLAFVVGFGVISIVEVVIGVWLQIDPNLPNGATVAAAMLVALVGVGVDRAWELIGGRATSFVSSITDVVYGEHERPASPDGE